VPILPLPIVGIFAEDGHVKVFDFGSDLRRKVLGIEQRNLPYAGLTRQNFLPHGLHLIPQRCDQPDARNYNPTFHSFFQ
jgi:hypothetical protein